MAGPAYYAATVAIAMNEDWIVPFVFGSVAEDGVTFTPIDLTDSILKMEIRKHETDAHVFVSVTNDPPGGGITITDAANGAFTVAIMRDRLTQLVPDETYVTDMVRELPTGVHERLFEGTATVSKGTTR